MLKVKPLLDICSANLAVLIIGIITLKLVFAQTYIHRGNVYCMWVISVVYCFSIQTKDIHYCLLKKEKGGKKVIKHRGDIRFGSNTYFTTHTPYAFDLLKKLEALWRVYENLRTFVKIIHVNLKIKNPGVFLRGGNPPNWHTSLSSRPSQREVVSFIFSHPPTTRKDIYVPAGSLRWVYPVNAKPKKVLSNV